MGTSNFQVARKDSHSFIRNLLRAFGYFLASPLSDYSLSRWYSYYKSNQHDKYIHPKIVFSQSWPSTDVKKLREHIEKTENEIVVDKAIYRLTRFDVLLDNGYLTSTATYTLHGLEGCPAISECENFEEFSKYYKNIYRG